MYFDETIGCATSEIDQLRDGRYLYAITKAAAAECPYGVFSSKFWSRRFQRVKEYIPGLQDSMPFVCGLVRASVWIGYDSPNKKKEKDTASQRSRDLSEDVILVSPCPLHDRLSLSLFSFRHDQNNYTADSFLYVPPLGITDQELKYFDFPQVIARQIRALLLSWLFLSLLFFSFNSTLFCVPLSPPFRACRSLSRIGSLLKIALRI